MFEVNGKYHNRKGNYTVLAIKRPMMKVRFEDGTVTDLRINIQERIWQNILADQEKTKRKVTRKKAVVSSDKNKYYIQSLRLTDVEDTSASALQERLSYLIGNPLNLSLGDRFIYYAIELGVFFAVATATGSPTKAGRKVPKYVSNEDGTMTVIPLDWDAHMIDIENGIDIATVELESQPNFKKLLNEKSISLSISEDDFELLAELITEQSEDESEDDAANSDNDDDDDDELEDDA